MARETFKIAAVEDLDEVVAALAARVEEYNDTKAVVVALYGDLGAGKTTFMQQFARHYGVKEVVTSPTFVVMKQYELDGQSFDQIIHIDAYRLESNEELTVLGFSELLATPRTLICIEWAEKVADLLPADIIQLSFAIAGNDRIITLEYGQEK